MSQDLLEIQQFEGYAKHYCARGINTGEKMKNTFVVDKRKITYNKVTFFSREIFYITIYKNICRISGQISIRCNPTGNSSPPAYENIHYNDLII